MSNDREELLALARDLRGHLEWLRESGVGQIERPKRAASPAPGDGSSRAAAAAASGPSLLERVRAAAGAQPARPVAAQAAIPPLPARGPAAPPAATSSVVGAVKTLEQVRAELGACTRCKLCSGRKNIVFGVGDPRAELVFVGEGPGADEDAQGEPFVGRAGELLTKMIEAMGYGREQVYICNVVKCRPPGNRNPEPDEIQACEPFLKAQLASIRPKVIVALGKFAAQTLLRVDTPITRLRGNWREYEGVRLMPTFHPAYLLRQPTDKKLVWEDLKQVMAALGKSPPPKR